MSIDFPSERLIGPISSALRAKYGDNVFVINMSEREYDFGQLPGHQLSVTFRGLPSPPLAVLVRMCVEIHQWLDLDPANVVAVHCFPGLSRTIVLICSYLAWSGQCEHPVDALPETCNRLGIDDCDSPILPSQKRYLNYFFNLLSPQNLPPPVPVQSLVLTRLILNGVPNIPMGTDSLFRPFFEVWINGTLTTSSIENLKEYPINCVDEECVVSFDIPADTVLSGDVLLRIRHLSNKGVRYTCLRFAFNTNYVSDNILHLSKAEIDGNSFSSCVVDLITEKANQVVESDSGAADIFKKGFAISESLRKTGLAKIDTQHRSIEVNQERLETPNKIGSEDVDDFFAQLERDAQL